MIPLKTEESRDRRHFTCLSMSLAVYTRTYLIFSRFTFLATLLLLLAISFAIVFRSYILRRRYRQRLEAAIEQGLLPSRLESRRRKKNIGRKPKVWDIWISPSPASYWDDITVRQLNYHHSTFLIKHVSYQPLSARLMFKPREKSEEPPATAGDNASPDTNRVLSVLLGYTPRQVRSANNRSRSLATAAVHEKETPIGLQVSVIISMPSQIRATTKDKLDLDDEEFPDVALGVTQLADPLK